MQTILSRTAFIISRVAYKKEEGADKDTDICKAPVIAMLLFVLPFKSSCSTGKHRVKLYYCKAMKAMVQKLYCLSKTNQFFQGFSKYRIEFTVIG